MPKSNSFRLYLDYNYKKSKHFRYYIRRNFKIILII